MNILIYIPELSQEWGGVKQYALALLRNLVNDRDNSYFVYHNSNDLQVVEFLIDNKNFTLIEDRNYKEKIRRKVKNNIKSFLNKPLKFFSLNYGIYHESVIDNLCAQFAIDVVYCPYQYIPRTKKAKLITTLHDVQEIHFPEYFTPEQRAHRAVNFLDYLNRADKVVVSYKHVKEDLIKFFKVPEYKIHVVLLDMGELWFEKLSPNDIIPLEGMNLPENFIFYPANTWKHKNHLRLLQAIALLRDKYNIKVPLVCTGHQTEHFYEEILQAQNELNLREQVSFLGVVSERELFSLYNAALGVIVPTVYEAGSFPLMESILLRVPVICSNVTSLPDTIKDQRFVFNPFLVEDIAVKLKEMWESENFRKDSIVNSEQVGHCIKKTNALKEINNLYAELNCSQTL